MTAMNDRDVERETVSASPARAHPNVVGRSVALAIAEALKDAGLSQRAFGRLLGVDQATVSGWVRGTTTPSIERVVAIEQTLGLEPGTLLTSAVRDRTSDDRLETPSRAGYQDFERRYREQVTEHLGYLELFGVGPRGTVPSHSLERFYVTPAVARVGFRPIGEDVDELTGEGIDIADGLTDVKRIIVQGVAGAGKTTLLRWLAVRACRRAAAPAHEPASVPFVVPLRQVATEPLPTPDRMLQTTADVIAAEMPPGWATEQFRNGRGLLLVDGVDEVQPARRREVREWLKQLVTAYPEARFVVTTRPFAIAPDWLDDAGFATFDLLPLSPPGVSALVAAWYEAARQVHQSDPTMQDWLDEGERSLTRQMETRPELRRFASRPMLCGLLCALHQRRDVDALRNRKALYDAALDHLLDAGTARFTETDGWPILSRDEQIVLLQRLAYSMVRNHEVLVSREVAAARIAHAMRGLRSQDLEVEGVLQRLLERTGLLREPTPGEVQFVDRSFRDYLAAKEIVDAGDLDFLVEQAHLDHWYDVVVSAVAQARPNELDYILRALLDGNTASKADPRLQDRLHLVAAACLAQADGLDGGDTRERVEQAAARLIPPTTLDEAEALARMGPFVLDLLPGPQGVSPEQAAGVVRTVALIGGEGTPERLAELVTVGAAGAESTVIDELLRAWRRSSDPEEYARSVLADVDFGDRRLEVRGWHRVRALPHLKHLSELTCYGDFADLEPLAAVPRLRRLELVQNELVRELRPLSASRTLRTLALTSGCQLLRDLSPLAETTVDDLALILVNSDLATLRGVGLRRLVVRDRRLAEGLHPLPDDLPLQELVVDNLPRVRNLAGIDRWPDLAHVSVVGAPRPDEITALARLPALRRLTINRPESMDHLAGLRALPALRQLDLRGVEPGHAETFASALPDVTIRIDDRSLEPREIAGSDLTPREREIALLAARGMNRREIAERLSVSPRTVDFHLGRVHRKLGLRQRSELSAAAERL